MLLAIDVGNTNIVAGVFDREDRLAATWRLSTDPRRMPDEYSVLLRSLFELENIEPGNLHGAVICSVVPSVQAMLCESIEKTLGLNPLILTSDLDVGLEVRYSPPTSVGADRIANAVATI